MKDVGSVFFRIKSKPEIIDQLEYILLLIHFMGEKKVNSESLFKVYFLQRQLRFL